MFPTFHKEKNKYRFMEKNFINMFRNKPEWHFDNVAKAKQIFSLELNKNLSSTLSIWFAYSRNFLFFPVLLLS